MRCNIYISRLCYNVSVRLSVRLFVTKVHFRIIANLGLKFWSQFTAHCSRGACEREGRDHHREEWRDHLALCQPLPGPLVNITGKLFCNMPLCQGGGRIQWCNGPNFYPGRQGHHIAILGDAVPSRRRRPPLEQDPGAAADLTQRCG